MIKFIFLVVTSSTYKIVDSHLSVALSDLSNFVQQVFYVTIHGKNKIHNVLLGRIKKSKLTVLILLNPHYLNHPSTAHQS